VAPLGYIEEFEVVDDHRAGKIVVFLNGRINKVGGAAWCVYIRARLCAWRCHALERGHSLQSCLFGCETGDSGAAMCFCRSFFSISAV
jgi:hypothetical protein